MKILKKIAYLSGLLALTTANTLLTLNTRPVQAASQQIGNGGIANLFCDPHFGVEGNYKVRWSLLSFRDPLVGANLVFRFSSGEIKGELRTGPDFRNPTKISGNVYSQAQQEDSVEMTGEAAGVLFLYLIPPFSDRCV